MGNSSNGFQWTQEGGLQAGLPTLGVVSPSQKLEADQLYDVIVIGAGYAGLTAARDLTTNGFKVLLIEARDRIGGRTWSSNLDGYAFELGGTWVHWNQPHVYREISRYGLQEDLENSHDLTKGVKSFILKEGGQTHTMTRAQEEELMTDLMRKLVNIDGACGRQIAPKPGHASLSDTIAPYDHMSIADRVAQLGLTRDQAATLEGFLSITCGGTLESASFGEMIRWWALNNYDMQLFMEQCLTYKFKSGQSHFARQFFDEALASNNLSYIFNTPITAVVDSGESVLVTSKSGQSFPARRVVCAIPLNVLSSVSFSPPLSPIKLQTSRQGHVNHVSKVHVECANPELRSLSSTIANPHKGLTYLFGDGTTPSGNTHLVAFGSSYPGVHLHPEDDIEATKGAFQAFVDGKMDIKRVVFHNWSRDEFARGAWEWLRPGQIADRRVLEGLREKQGNVHFASADWAVLWRGFIDGGIEDGARVAWDVKRELMCQT